MDGVLADFMGACCSAHNRPDPYLLDSSKGIWETEKVWGISEREFWKPIDALGIGFWDGILKTPEADRIVNLVVDAFGEDNIAILTAPSTDPGCVPGKMAWIKRHYPQFKKRIIFGHAKEFLSAPYRVLIDDRDKNVENFRAAGGLAILVPRPWNKAHFVKSGHILLDLAYNLANIVWAD
jgi:5'(3')-deoxyribonucleotidase